MLFKYKVLILLVILPGTLSFRYINGKCPAPKNNLFNNENIFELPFMIGLTLRYSYPLSLEEGSFVSEGDWSHIVFSNFIVKTNNCLNKRLNIIQSRIIKKNDEIFMGWNFWRYFAIYKNVLRLKPGTEIIYSMIDYKLESYFALYNCTQLNETVARESFIVYESMNVYLYGNDNLRINNISTNDVVNYATPIKNCTVFDKWLSNCEKSISANTGYFCFLLILWVMRMN